MPDKMTLIDVLLLLLAAFKSLKSCRRKEYCLTVILTVTLGIGDIS